ncbi:unnamed protein product [Rotaria sp. Silwood2]|nr:unnamed protein product [Rotaria sp. Silwood2]CAF4499236.1 unnamed protein product [Rotaria sp. Silwood2]
MDRQKFLQHIRRTEFNVTNLNVMKTRAQNRLGTYQEMKQRFAGHDDAKLLKQVDEYYSQTESEIDIINGLLHYAEHLKVLVTFKDDAGLSIIDRLLSYAEHMVDLASKKPIDSETNVTDESDKSNESDEPDKSDESGECDISDKSDESDEKPTTSVKGIPRVEKTAEDELTEMETGSEAHSMIKETKNPATIFICNKCKQHYDIKK